MNFSAGKPLRKWSCGRFGCDQWTGALVVAAAMLLCAMPAHAYLTNGSMPLPKPRPAEASRTPQPADADKAEPAVKPAEPEAPAAEVHPAAPPPPSACRLALTEAIAVAPSVPDIHGPGACGGPDMVHLEAVVLPDGSKVPLKPGGTMRCTMASAVADWIRTDMAPLASSLGTKVSEIDNFDSFDCRGRNRVVGARMSEHGRANALDIRAIKLASGQSIALTERGTPRELREKVLLSVCTRFTTVLGPGSDGYHEDHIHIDLAERRNNYKICQWDVWDPLPQVAPLLPALRPDEAPPREVAETEDGKRDGKPAAAAEPAPELAVAPVPEARPAAAPVRERAAAAPEPVPVATARGRVAASAKQMAPEPAVKPGTSVGGAPLKLKPKPRKRRAPPPLFPFFR
ncbi:hypothetical protein BH11PSE4_BH11PSE4_03770 [soil metagenome]